MTFAKGNKIPVTHGRWGTPVYNSWATMKARCNNPGATAYHNYGARGIGHCDRWNSFELFLIDMGDRPPGHTLDRINNNGNYSKENCKWSTVSDQNRNRRVTSNTGEKFITRIKSGKFIVTFVKDNGSRAHKYFTSLESAISFRDQKHKKEKTMKVTDIRYTKRFNIGEYQHEEYTLAASLDDGDSPTEAIATLRADVALAHSGDTAPAEVKPAKTAKKGKKEAPPAEEEEEEEAHADSEEEEESEEESEEEESEEEESEEEEEKEEKPVKTGKKSFKKKPQSYSRSSEQHKEILSTLLKSVAPDWKKTDDGKAKAKNASQKMEGKDFLDEEGEVLQSFKDEVKKLMAPAKKK